MKHVWKFLGKKQKYILCTVVCGLEFSFWFLPLNSTEKKKYWNNNKLYWEMHAVVSWFLIVIPPLFYSHGSQLDVLHPSDQRNKFY